MVPVKARFIFNPHSGRNARNPYLLERARAFIWENRLAAEVVLTERRAHATELARRAVAEGCSLVVAIGGDGTLNEVATGLIGSSAALGLIPCGSGNGLGRHLGIPNPGRGAFQTLLHGRVRTIDTGVVDGLPFFNAMGVGFDAEISARFNRLTKRGFSAYVRTTAGLFFQYRPGLYTIRSGDTELKTTAFLVTVANSDQYGNDCFIAPGATVDDGLLDLTVIKRASLFGAVPLAARLFTKSIDRSGAITRLRGATFVLERPSAGPIHTDGEVHEAGARMEISVRPQSLRVMVPDLTSRP